MASADVSAIIPCFNAASTLERAVESVANQNLPVRELLLVDDASTDASLAVARELQKKHGEDWLRILALSRNGGVAHARNRGWDAARGKYIAFLDADDSWLPDKIAVQYEFMERHPGFAATAHGVEVENGRAARVPFWARNQPYWNATFVQLLFLSRMVTPSVMIRREIAERFEDNRRYMEDHLLLIEIARAHGAVPRLHQVLCRLHKAHVGAGGLSSHLVPMFRADVTNYWILRRKKLIGAIPAFFLSSFATAKFLRRALLCAWRAA